DRRMLNQPEQPRAEAGNPPEAAALTAEPRARRAPPERNARPHRASRRGENDQHRGEVMQHQMLQAVHPEHVLREKVVVGLQDCVVERESQKERERAPKAYPLTTACE